MQHADLAKITSQLGRPPRGVERVARRCLAGHPQVIVTYPIQWTREEPAIFPTLYWLTCPALRQKVGSLETDGWIKRLQHRMEADINMAKQWEKAHDEYARQRVQLVPQAELVLLREQYPAQAQVLEETGIGGARGRGIKCLHTNLAHYLAERGRQMGKVNPIGEAVAQLLIEQEMRLDFCYDDELEEFCRGYEEED
ncbi:MAG: DUF501 domain-containing protein [Firmicutes bacterium]|nr:DUF501 domain-containing protein [Bacillota bacterium]